MENIHYIIHEKSSRNTQWVCFKSNLTLCRIGHSAFEIMQPACYYVFIMNGIGNNRLLTATATAIHDNDYKLMITLTCTDDFLSIILRSDCRYSRPGNLLERLCNNQMWMYDFSTRSIFSSGPEWRALFRILRPRLILFCNTYDSLWISWTLVVTLPCHVS